MDCAVAVDIGGTSIKYGLIDRNGNIIFKSKCPSNAQLGASRLLDNLSHELKELLVRYADYEITGIGVATAGQIDPVTGKVLYATPNIPGYTGFDLKGIFESEFGLRTFVENDVNAATIGEVWKGSGIGARKILCITVGTGIGGCIMFDGKVEHGILGSAGEVGHIIIDYGGRPCNCGNRGCLEQYASASAMIRDFTLRLKNGEKSLITELPAEEKDIDAQLIFSAAKKGDKLANEVIDEFVKYLGTGIISLVHTLNPELVIIGGGISAEGEYLSDKIDKYVRKFAMPSFMRNFRIVTANLGNDAGIMGAAKNAFDNIG